MKTTIKMKHLDKTSIFHLPPAPAGPTWTSCWARGPPSVCGPRPSSWPPAASPACPSPPSEPWPARRSNSPSRTGGRHTTQGGSLYLENRQKKSDMTGMSEQIIVNPKVLLCKS